MLSSQGCGRGNDLICQFGSSTVRDTGLNHVTIHDAATEHGWIDAPAGGAGQSAFGLRPSTTREGVLKLGPLPTERQVTGSVLFSLIRQSLLHSIFASRLRIAWLDPSRQAPCLLRRCGATLYEARAYAPIHAWTYSSRGRERPGSLTHGGPFCCCRKVTDRLQLASCLSLKARIPGVELHTGADGL